MPAGRMPIWRYALPYALYSKPYRRSCVEIARKRDNVNNKYRIAIIVPGGIGEKDNVPAIIDLLSRLAEEYTLAIYSFSHAAPHHILLEKNCRIYFPPKTAGNSTILKLICLLVKMKTHTTGERIDLVHGFWIMPQGLAAVLASRWLKIPSIVSSLGGDIVYVPEIDYGAMRTAFSRRVIRWVVKHAHIVTVLTRYQQTLMQSAGMSQTIPEVIPFGVELSTFTFQPKEISSQLKLGFIGNLNSVKDPFTLIKTFSLILAKVECTLTIVGPDYLDGEVQKYASALGVEKRIQWVGKVPHAMVAHYLHAIDVVILPSWYEGEGVVIMEAFASGVIAVGTNVGLLADVGDQSVVVKPGDAEGLAEKILRLTAEPKRVSAMQLRNRKIAEQWSMEWTATQFKNEYKKAMELGFKI